MTATIHNPAHFEPADYEVLDYFDNHRPEYCGQSVESWRAEIAQWEVELARVYGPDWIRKIHTCVHCGSGRVRWITAVRHLPTNEVVTFGAICTDRLGFANRQAFKLAQLQARAEARKVRFTIYTKRQAFLAAHPEIAEALTAVERPEHQRNLFVQNVLQKLDQYGSLSDLQVTTVVKSLAKDCEIAARKAAEATEAKGDAPTGRTTVSGVILALRNEETDFGWTRKALIRLENNARVWVTANWGEIERGDAVTVRATWTVSKDDRSFAFGKRPHLVGRTPVTLPGVEHAAV